MRRKLLFQLVAVLALGVTLALLFFDPGASWEMLVSGAVLLTATALSLRSGRKAAVALALLAAVLPACGTSPPKRDPVYPRSVVVTEYDDAQTMGGRARYVVKAPFEVVRETILDFPAQKDFRPMVLSAEPISWEEGGGEVRFQFKGVMGLNPVADCMFTEEYDEGISKIKFEMINRSMTLRALQGAFEIRSIKGGRETLVTQEFLVAALMMNRESLLADLKADAEAIRAEAERRAAARGN